MHGAEREWAFIEPAEMGWAVAQSPILLTTITVHRLKQRGYTPMLDVYYELNPSLNEPPPDHL